MTLFHGTSPISQGVLTCPTCWQVILNYPISLKHPASGTGTWPQGSLTCIMWGDFASGLPWCSSDAPRNTLLFKANESDLAARVFVWTLSLPVWSAWAPTSSYSENLCPWALTLTLEVPAFFLHGHAPLFARVQVNSSLAWSCFLSTQPSGSRLIPKPTQVMFTSDFTSHSGRFAQIRPPPWCSELDPLGPILHFRVPAQDDSFPWRRPTCSNVPTPKPSNVSSLWPDSSDLLRTTSLP